jgi:hypothetical protein
LQPANAIPERALSTGVNPADSAFFNLIRQSAPSADTAVSNHATYQAARNGRKLDANRWNAPALLPGSGFAANDQLPNWIYVDRKLGLTATPSADVIGRIAYNAYDLGGLLNANVAGHVSGLSADQLLYLKAGQGGADLTRLPSGSGTLSQSCIDALTAFRDPSSYPAPPSAAVFTGKTLGAAANGYLSVFGNDFFPPNSRFQQSMFGSRQELIRYARTQNTALQGALPYLTHFSRSVNAPSWAPPAASASGFVYGNPDIPNVRYGAGGTVAHYDDLGQASSYAVQAGEPVMQRRFSLAKLAWLTPTGPASGITAGAIQKVFGLQWNSAQERWDYVGPSGSTVQGSIKTLAQVAAEPAPREPNFFEVLKAGILDGSLGVAVSAKTYDPTNPNASLRKAMSVCTETNNDLDANRDLHVLRIGANIMDCADSDNYPSILALSWGGIAVEKAGTEDIPYFYALDMANLRNGTFVTTPTGQINFTFTSSDYVWVPELFNPHRASSPASGPQDLRVEIMNGFLRDAGFGDNGYVINIALRGSPNKDLAVLPPIPVPSASWETYRSSPAPVRDAGASNRLGVLVPGATDTDVLAFRVFSHGNSADYPGTFPTTLNNCGSKIAVLKTDGVVLGLRYKTPANRWKTYATLGGYEAFPGESGIDGVYRDDFEFRVLKTSDSINNSKVTMAVKAPSLVLQDPRTSRFGPMIARYQRPLANPPQFATSGTGWNYTVGVALFFQPVDYLLRWMGNMPQKAAFPDPDSGSTPRVPDGSIGFTGTGSASTPANPYGNLNDASRRPLILQRPFRNVGELGYVFRDTAWQTLNMWNSKSGDGALLDLFSVRDEPGVTASRVALTTRQTAVVRALLAGVSQEADGSQVLSAVQESALESAWSAYAYSSGTPTSAMPDQLADLADFMSSTGATAALSAVPVKYRRESFVRALASSTQARTWNVLLDVVAQAGRFPGAALGPGDFVVEAEARSWASAAVDRYTGKVVELQSEKVHE